MRLTRFSDYSLRVLIYLGVQGERLSTTGEVAAAYAISEHHLTKVVYRLVQNGYIQTVRGKGGGMRLARDPDEINIGDVVRRSEGKPALVECFDEVKSECRIDSACALKGMLFGAVGAFFDVLKNYTLADLLASRTKLARTLNPAKEVAANDTRARAAKRR